MSHFLFDFITIAVLIISFTALNGVFSHFIGLSIFGRKKGGQFVDATASTQKGWKQITGGR